ncbi:hypothetical protein Tco_0543995 [Tanacetum coccineum]
MLKLENKEIMETFPLETLRSVALRVDSTPWFTDFANYHAGNFIVKGMYPTKKQVIQRLPTYFWDGPLPCSKSVADQMIARCRARTKKSRHLEKLSTMIPRGTSRCKSHRQKGL